MTALEFNNHILGYENNLRKFAISLTSDIDDASDLVQETYLKAFSYKDRLANYSNLKSWMFSIMKNTFINNYHRSSRIASSIDSSAQFNLMNNYDDAGRAAPDSIFSESEIMNAVEKLDDKYKIAFKMHLAGYKYKEIAEELNLNIGTVKSRIFNARQLLMGAFEDLRN
jgi:RNA polymerase sigma-70 factor (ECF subfamily)